MRQAEHGGPKSLLGRADHGLPCPALSEHPQAHGLRMGRRLRWGQLCLMDIRSSLLQLCPRGHSGRATHALGQPHTRARGQAREKPRGLTLVTPEPGSPLSPAHPGPGLPVPQLL